MIRIAIGLEMNLIFILPILLGAAASSTSAAAPTLQCLNYDSIKPGQLVYTSFDQTGYVMKDDFNYYYFSAPAQSVVTITMTTFYGNADLYVSYASRTLKPDSSYYAKRSTNTGRSDITTIDSVVINSYADNCISIGVYGKDGVKDEWGRIKSYYRLSVQTSTLVSICLSYYPSFANSNNTLDYYRLSKQFSGQVRPGLFQYFFVSVDDSLPVTLTLENDFGDSDLYVSNAEGTTSPDRDHYDFYSIHLGAERLNLSSTVTNEPTCYSVGVFGSGSYNTFILSVTPNSPIVVPTSAPTFTPTYARTFAPTYAPTSSSTSSPSFASTSAPTSASTSAPTSTPTSATTSAPISTPSSGEDHSILYIFLGMIITLVVCVVIAVTLLYLRKRRRAQAVPVGNEASPLLHPSIPPPPYS